MANVNEVFLKAVKGCVAGDRKHGWGVDDSLEVILALIADENGSDVKDIKEASPDLVKHIRMVINPSAFRQTLETKKILDETVGKKRASSDAFADYEKL